MASHCCAVSAPDLLIGSLTQAELLFLMAASAAPPLSVCIPHKDLLKQ